MRKKDRHELPSPIQPQLVLSLCARFLKKGTIVLEIAVSRHRCLSGSAVFYIGQGPTAERQENAATDRALYSRFQNYVEKVAPDFCLM